VSLSRKLPFYFDLPKAIAISMAIHIILMIGLPELNKPLLIPQEMSVTISSSPIQKPIEKIETPEPVKKTVSKIPNIVPQEQLTQHLESYSSLLANAIAKYKQYPKIAQMRGWQGTVIADLEIDSKGTVISIKIKKSSTYEVLDNEALEMIRKASPFPAPPESLRGKNFNVLVPISFKLE